MIFSALLLVYFIIQTGAVYRNYYNDLRLLSTSKGISVQMNGTILYIKRKRAYGNNDQKMFLSLPDDECPISIQYGSFVFQALHYRFIDQIIEKLPEFKLFTNQSSKESNEEKQKVKDIQPIYLKLINYLLKVGNAKNVKVCHNLSNQGCSNGISVSYRALLDLFNILKLDGGSNYYEVSKREVHLFMVVDTDKIDERLPDHLWLHI